MPPAGLKLFYPVKPTFPITQLFGENPKWYPLTKGHNGIDWGIPLRTPVYATLPGTVARVGSDSSGYGNHIRISHDHNLLSLYGHLDESKYALVKVGDVVQAGQQIGFSGNTGRSTGPHLHFEVREGSTAFDPKPYLTSSLPKPVDSDSGDVSDVNKPVAVDAPVFKVRITADPTINVRTGPGVAYPSIGSFKLGDIVDVLELAGNEIWVRTPKGFIAFRYNGLSLAEVEQPKDDKEA